MGRKVRLASCVVVVAVATTGLSGCSTVGGWLGFNSKPIWVHQVAAATDCHANIHQDSVQVLETPMAVGHLELQRNFRLRFPGALPAGPFALLDIAPRHDDARGVSVSRQAFIHRGTLYLTATYFPAVGALPAGHPCVLVALPAGDYDEVTVLDPSGEIKASAERNRSG
ncbi:MAG: hypothetical protein L0H29_02440 [Sinobacteraceae bacterium]|nr:hypothetical protein [Nevskiaceae bacterium]